MPTTNERKAPRTSATFIAMHPSSHLRGGARRSPLRSRPPPPERLHRPPLGRAASRHGPNRATCKEPTSFACRRRAGPSHFLPEGRVGPCQRERRQHGDQRCADPGLSGDPSRFGVRTPGRYLCRWSSPNTTSPAPRQRCWPTMRPRVSPQGRSSPSNGLKIADESAGPPPSSGPSCCPSRTT